MVLVGHHTAAECRFRSRGAPVKVEDHNEPGGVEVIHVVDDGGLVRGTAKLRVGHVDAEPAVLVE